jgi:hypothetical protein
MTIALQCLSRDRIGMGRGEAARQVLYFLSRERIKSTVRDRVVFHDKFFIVCHGYRWLSAYRTRATKLDMVGLLHDKLFVVCH